MHFYSSRSLCSHDVIARINEENFPGDGTSERTIQEERGVAHPALLDVATQRRGQSHVLTEVCETRNSTPGQCVERPRSHGIYSNVLSSNFLRTVTYPAF